ncbi:MAG: hypothetical protein GWN71_19825, partial [Gammaproteobacteria bacterium]|nr:hypothetical protein [Actinomycetota bacterium]NIU75732.1 hypothetical protein [Gammaproteobacteria bacterium]
VRWLDPDTGLEDEEATLRCHLPTPISDTQYLCSSPAQYAALVDAEANERIWLRETPPGDAEPVPLRGSHFRLVDDEYLVYVSIEGELRAARWYGVDRPVGRSVALISGVRR